MAPRRGYPKAGLRWASQPARSSFRGEERAAGREDPPFWRRADCSLGRWAVVICFIVFLCMVVSRVSSRFLVGVIRYHLVLGTQGWEHGGKKGRCEGIKNIIAMVSCSPLLGCFCTCLWASWACLVIRFVSHPSGQIKHRAASAGYHLPSRRRPEDRLQQQPPTLGEAPASACSTRCMHAAIPRETCSISHNWELAGAVPFSEAIPFSNLYRR